MTLPRLTKERPAVASRTTPSSLPEALDPITSSTANLTRWLHWLLALWTLSAGLSAFLHWAIELKPAPVEISFAREADLLGKIAHVHAGLLEVVDGSAIAEPADRTRLHQRITEQKDNLRDLALSSIQDPWSRDALVKLRHDLVLSYFGLQQDLERIAVLAPGSLERQQVFEDMRAALEAGRAQLVTTAIGLGVLPSELHVKEADLTAIFGTATVEESGR